MLFRFFMNGMFFAEFAILADFDSFSVVLFVFERIVVSLFAFRTCQSNFRSCAFCCHSAPSEHEKINTPFEMLIYFTIYGKNCQGFGMYF